MTSVAAFAATTYWPSTHRINMEPIGSTGPVFGPGRARHLDPLRQPTSAPGRAGHSAKRTSRRAAAPARHPAAPVRVPTPPPTPPPRTTPPTTAPPAPPAPMAATACGTAIAAVEAQGLTPGPGFAVVCPGDALGREGMTCINEPGICPGQWTIMIAVAEPLVVANEFENSRIMTGQPIRCDIIDCGGAAYGF